MQVLFKRASVQPYSKPFHTLRKSCLTDWAQRFPQHVVSEWGGHSDIQTTNEYYLQVPASEYDRCAQEGFFEESPKKPDFDEKNAQNEENRRRQHIVNQEVSNKAGERTRTVDVQLGRIHGGGCKSLADKE